MTEPVNRLRRILAALEAGEPLPPDDATRHAAALRTYLDDAPLGLTTDRAFGLIPAAGQLPWWREEARQQRNAAIIELHRHRFADLGLSQAARKIAALVAQVQRADRRTKIPVPMDERTEALVTAALLTGVPFPGPKQIVNILEIK